MLMITTCACLSAADKSGVKVPNSPMADQAERKRGSLIDDPLS